MKKYNIINNTLGWLTFVVAAVTYLLTIEPTASFWDCPEFIAQAMKSEVGHPPGNPIFILAGRFAANFAGGDVMAVAKCVNAMSALLSAGTILLLFWTITHLVKRLVVRDGETDSMTLAQYLVVMGSGLCGALVYTWSDTFWFSAVEAEVYAFSSFCTALVVWLILKWEDRADQPGSDRYLILIAYVFGFSLGVHLLNLLCIPAIALVMYYRKAAHATLKGSLITLLISFVVIVLILYGLEPGFVEVAGYFDLFFVNTLGMSFNSGVLFYAALALAVFSWSIYELYTAKSEQRMRLSFFLTILISGMAFIGDNLLIPVVLLAALGYYLFKMMKRVPVRLFGNIVMSVLMIFIGFSCYALIIIRSSANTPLDENSPNSMFALSSYLSRDQYGKTPLLYGPVYTASTPQFESTPEGTASTRMKVGKTQWARQVKANENDPDRYIEAGKSIDYVYPSEMNMLFPRIWSTNPGHTQYYNSFFDVENRPFGQVNATVIVDENGNPDTRFQQAQQYMPRPSFWNNMQFFVSYQLNYMYFRYFMWNFAGRQNDVQGLNGEAGDVTRGNWITGFSAIDNARLGDQELLPDDYGKNNKGHNVFYCLPLLLGLLGLLWQGFKGERGIQQFWVVFFLFFMTGIAIVLYLNQPPMQPRERDYAYAGSFYAWSIWVGMGVAALWNVVCHFMAPKAKKGAKAQADSTQAVAGGASTAVAAVAAVVGLLVPLQMVSQTWDDHDRSMRYAARDFGMNYLSSVAPNGIIFTNGDNDTFPLWYLQEVEGYRTDVRVVNMSYLATDWYISQMRRASYESAPVPMQATDLTFAYGDRQASIVTANDSVVSLTQALTALYGNDSDRSKDGRVTGLMPYNRVTVAANADAAVKAGVISQWERAQAADTMYLSLGEDNSQMVSSEAMVLDIINSSIKDGWKRPVYFACTVDSRLYEKVAQYLRNTGMAYQVVPVAGNAGDDPKSNTDVMYENVTTKFRWGGLDTADPSKLYLDETVRRMVNTTRTMMVNLAGDLADEAQQARESGQATWHGMPTEQWVADRTAKALNILKLMQEKLPEAACRYGAVIFRNQYVGCKAAMAEVYHQVAQLNGKAELTQQAATLVEQEVLGTAQYVRFASSLAAAHPGLAVCDLDRRMSFYNFPMALLAYKNINPNGYDALLKKVNAMGVGKAEVDQLVAQYMQLMYQMSSPAPQPQPRNSEDENEDLQGLPADARDAMDEIEGEGANPLVNN